MRGKNGLTKQHKTLSLKREGILSAMVSTSDKIDGGAAEMRGQVDFTHSSSVRLI